MATSSTMESLERYVSGESFTFEAGRSGLHPDARQYFGSRNRTGYLAAREAARDWRRASLDHADTSFYGAARIRSMRAFWLGVARGIGEAS